MYHPGEACPSGEEYWRDLKRRTLQAKIPTSGSLELTQRCNLECVHCYAGPQGSERKQRELTTDEQLRVIDQMTEAGCLFLVMTGGEPLLREDFAKIYRRAKTNGLLVTVFTNGTLVGDRVIALFSDLPPQTVEISLYGATAATHERVTRVKGSHRRCLAGVKRLLESGVRVRLKTMLMTLNRHELRAMEEMAEALGVPFRFDPALFPRLDGDRTPISLRVSPEEATEEEFRSRQKVAQWRVFLEKYGGISRADTVYRCAAGKTCFHVDAYGNLKPCLMTTGIDFSLVNGAFHDGWRRISAAVEAMKSEAGKACTDCDKKVLCGYCPAFFKLETGSQDVFSEYLCAIGRHRLEVLDREFDFRLT